MNSMYAFLALIAIITLSVNHQRSLQVSRVNLMRGEVYVVAGGVANEKFETLSAIPFDSLRTFDDSSVEIAMPFEADTFHYDVHTVVTYASYDGTNFTPSVLPTDLLEVTLTITGELESRITTSRIFNKSDS
jgi:hypothetical protein